MPKRRKRKDPKPRMDKTYKEGVRDLVRDGSVPFNFPVGHDFVIPKGTRIVTDEKGEVVKQTIGGFNRVFIHPDDIDKVIERNKF